MAQIHLEIEDQIKIKSESILYELGLDLNGAIKIFLRQVILKGGLPFEILIPDRPGSFPAQEEQPRPSLEFPQHELREEELMGTQGGRLLLLMRDLHDKGMLNDGMFKTDIEKLYRQRYPDDDPKDLAQALSDGCNPKYAGKLGVVYERVHHAGKTRTGVYKLKTA